MANQHSDIDPQLVKDLGWLPLLALMIYIFFFSIGKKIFYIVFIIDRNITRMPPCIVSVLNVTF